MKYVVIDNFFDNPNEIIKLSESMDYRSRNDTEYWEGIRTECIKDIDMELYTNITSKIIYSYFDTNCAYAIEGNLVFHKMNEKDHKDPNWDEKIHKDASLYSCVIYLTPNAPMSSGTQTYQKEQWNSFLPDIICHNNFNRLIMFPGDVYHSAMDTLGGNGNDRLTLLFFLHKIDKVDID